MMVIQNCTLFAVAMVSLITAATTLLLQLIMLTNNNNSTNEALLLFKAESENRFTALEIQNRNQDEEMEFLKIENLEMHRKINQMKRKLNNNGIIAWNSGDGLKSSGNAELVASNTDVSSFTAGLLTNKPKRPARLLPLQLVSAREEAPTVPSSCTDLSKMGHTLNGFYLVKGNSHKSRVNVVLCDFQPLGFSPSTIKEDRLGFVDTKSSNSPLTGIYFFVQRGNGPTSKDGVLRFHKEHLNIGKAMSISTGIFTIPKAGIYHFSFSISKEGFTLIDPFHVYLRVNKVKIGVTIVSPGPFSTPAVIQSTLKLKKGDRVDVWIPNKTTLGECTVLGGDAATEPPCHHFTGWLLEEDLNYL